MTDSLDLDAYLRRIGWRGELRPDLASLQRLPALHVAAIAFENLNPFLGRAVPLDLASVQRKLVHEGRGGYCFEQNLLFAEVLRATGFRVTGLAARVLWGRPEDAVTARSHMALLVDLPEGPHIVDVGFGGLTLTGVLRLQPGIDQPTPHEPFRLLEADGDWRMQARVRGEWKTLYRFDLQRQHAVDYEVSNYFVATNPASHFVNHLICARALPERRLALMDREFTVHPLHGDSVRRLLASPQAICEVLRSEFDIALPSPDELEQRLLSLFT